MKMILMTAAGAAMLALSGCIVVDSDEHEMTAIAANTETALRVCGGPGYVKEVSDDGFECMEADD